MCINSSVVWECANNSLHAGAFKNVLFRGLLWHSGVLLPISKVEIDK